MATKKSATNSARNTAKTSSTSSPKNAGKPTVESNSRSRDAGGATPSKAELDLRDRLKAGPRRQAGPPLVGDIMTRAAMDALRDEVVPKPTEPKKLKEGK